MCLLSAKLNHFKRKANAGVSSPVSLWSPRASLWMVLLCGQAPYFNQNRMRTSKFWFKETESLFSKRSLLNQYLHHNRTNVDLKKCLTLILKAQTNIQSIIIVWHQTKLTKWRQMPDWNSFVERSLLEIFSLEMSRQI